MPTVGVEMASADSTYAWDPVATPELNRITLFSGDEHAAIRPAAIRKRLRGVLERLGPRAIAVPGWSEPWSLAAMEWATETKTPVVMMSESQASDGDRRWWKESVKRVLIRLSSAALVGGTPHADYMESLGMARDRIFAGYDVVDNDYFTQGARAARLEAQATRERLGLPEQFFLANCRFIGKKNLIRLLAAFASFRQSGAGREWSLVLVGDGPLREQVLATAEDLGLGSSLILPGFRQYDELPAYYGLASAFVHASTVEQWGLVVNEAMAAGLPVLVSDKCGCARDLVVHGGNGFVFDPLQPDTLADYMSEVASSGDLRTRMGLASSETIAQWPAHRFAAGLEAAVACSQTARRASLTGQAVVRLLLSNSH